MPPKGYGHSIENIDAEARTAECAICGPVDIHGNGEQGGEKKWKCARANRARVRETYEARNPGAKRYRGTNSAIMVRLAELETRVRVLEGQYGQTKVVSYE